jgi:hypothetical protein
MDGIAAASLGRDRQAKSRSCENIAMNTDVPDSGELPNTFPARLVEKMESIGVSPKKALEYLAMFVVLGVVYYCYLIHGWKQNASNPDQIITLSDVPGILLKYFVVTAWPFALVAGLDPTWRSKDAGNVLLAAYVAAYVFWYHQTGCGFCLLAASFRTTPFILSALIAHSLGAWRHRSRLEE